MVKLKKRTISKIYEESIRLQNILIDRLKLFSFAKSAIDFYCKEQFNNSCGYKFSKFKNKFKLIQFRSDKEIKDITYKEMKKTGESFEKNELADAIFVLNMSTFEYWTLTMLKSKFLENPMTIFNKRNKNERRIDVSMIRQVNSIEQLWAEIIDNYLRGLPYEGMIKLLNKCLKEFDIPKSKIDRNIIEKINENSLCRNVIVHNHKKINTIYINKCGKFAKFHIDETVEITEDILFEQGDNLLKFMRDFRMNLI